MTKLQLQQEVERLQEALRKAEAENARLRRGPNEQQWHYSSAPPRIFRVLCTVANHCNVSVREIIGRSRRSDIAMAREICEYILRGRPYSLSLRATGKHVGGYHHATVLKNVRTISDQISVDTNLAALVSTIRTHLP